MFRARSSRPALGASETPAKLLDRRRPLPVSEVSIRSLPMGGVRPRSSALKVTLVLAILVLATFVASLGVGSLTLSPAGVWAGLTGRGSEAETIIVREIRLPRAILGFLIGATLGLSGAALQGLLRNPLASPSLFGAPQLAALAAVIVLGFGFADALSLALPMAAMAGAALSVGLLLLVAGPRASLLVLILAGLAISSLAGAGTALALNLAPSPFAALEITFWLLGSVEDRSFQHVLMALPLMAGSWVLLMWDRNAFRALTLGEEAAESLGFDLGRVRLRVVAGVAAGVGAAVAVSGTIAFIGLVAPHLVRPFLRYDPGRLLVPAALCGALLLMTADIAVRLIPSQTELKVGVLTALIGAPFFIALIFRRRREMTGAAT